MTRCYHRTTQDAATAILRDGFHDAEGTYMTTTMRRGVWLSDQPLTVNEGAWGEVVIEVDLPEDAFAEYEWVEARVTGKHSSRQRLSTAARPRCR